MSSGSKGQSAISIEVHNQNSTKDTRPAVAEAQISITPPKASEELKLEKPATSEKDAQAQSIRQERADSKSCSRLEQVFEKVWIWAFTLALVISLLLSASALSGESSFWMESHRESDKSRVGWRLACAEHKDPDFRPNPRSTLRQNALVPCGPDDSTSSLRSVINETSAYLGYSIFGVIVGGWLVAILIVVCSNYVPRTQGTCCHGFSVSGVWFVTGVALFALTVSFKYTVNNHLESHFEMRYSVTCKNFERDISLCSNVRSLDSCVSKCRLNKQGKMVCAGYQSCKLDERKTTCDEDGIGCALEPSWAFYCAIGCAISFLLMALILTFGSISISKDL